MLIDTDHPHFSRRTLIVGLSRAARNNDVHAADNELEVLGREWIT